MKRSPGPIWSDLICPPALTGSFFFINEQVQKRKCFGCAFLHVEIWTLDIDTGGCMRACVLACVLCGVKNQAFRQFEKSVFLTAPRRVIKRLERMFLLTVVEKSLSWGFRRVLVWKFIFLLGGWCWCWKWCSDWELHIDFLYIYNFTYRGRTKTCAVGTAAGWRYSFGF